MCCANKKTNFFTLFLLLSLFYPTHPFPPFYVCPHELACFLLNIHENYQLFSSLVFNSHTRILYDLSCSLQKNNLRLSKKPSLDIIIAKPSSYQRCKSKRIHWRRPVHTRRQCNVHFTRRQWRWPPSRRPHRRC